MEVHRAGAKVELTALEFRLLEYFLRNPRLVLSRSQILESVWGLDTDTTSNIVDVYVRYLRQKLEATRREPRLIQTVRGAGYSLRDSLVKIRWRLALYGTAVAAIGMIIFAASLVGLVRRNGPSNQITSLGALADETATPWRR